MEVCGSAHYWSRLFSKYGHEVKQISPQYVAPFRMGSKDDKNDAIAIAETNSCPGITKRGDGYLCGLLNHGSRSVVYRVINLPDEQSNDLHRWLNGVIARSGVNEAVVVLANKNARVALARAHQKTEYKAI